MKKFTLFTTLCAFIMGGCAETNLDNITPEKNTAIILPDLTAGFAEEDVTRTYVEGNKHLRWHEADHISAFFGNTLNRQYKFKGQTGDNSGTFSLVPSGELGTGNSLDAIYAVYPYNETATITDDGVITTNVPAVQTYAKNSFGKGANTMVAVTESVEDTFLAFRNTCGYLKLKLYGEAVIKKIELKGNFGEGISGNAEVVATYGNTPVLTMKSNAVQTITLDCTDGVVLGSTAETATEFWFVVPETTFKYGITITATDTNGLVFTRSTSNSIAISRNEIQPMSALKFVGEEADIEPISTSTITYTTDDGNIVDIFTTEGFGAGYISNVYDTANNIGTITFDGEITTIPAEAFLVCTNLTSVQIPNSVTTISEKAFYGCNYMEKIIIPASVTHIAETAFEGCSGEAHISCNVNDKAFVGALFTKVILDDCVTSLGQECFMDCTELKEVVLSKGLTSIPYCAFQNTAIESIIIPNTITVLEEGAFYQCGKLKHISLPDSVDVIGQAAFADCTSLTEIQMPTNMSSIGESAFSGCTSLIECIIPEGVTSIEEKLFHGCVNLKSLSLPSTLISLSGAFYNCGKLTRLNLTDINIWLRLIPKNVSGFLGGQHPFSDSPGGDIYVNGELLTDLVIPNNILKINGYLFQNCTSLRSLTIGSRVTEIGDSAFNGCRNLSSITFSKSTTKYGNYAFYDTGITEITITPNMANANTGKGLFKSCINLSKVIIQEGVTMIPVAMFGGDSVGCDNLTSVTIPTSVKTIGDCAFQSARSLRTIKLHDDITAIGCGAFKGCISMEEITLPKNLTVVKRDLFNGCTNLKKVNLYNDITSIEQNAFTDCHVLENLTLPKNLTTIGSEAFWYCHSLKHIDIPEGVKTIGYQVFLDSGLEEVVLPETLETIGYRAFACPIRTIIIPSSVIDIKAAFLGADKLEYAYFCSAQPPHMAGNIFDYAGTSTETGHTTIFVPNEALDAYKTALPFYTDQIVGYNL